MIERIKNKLLDDLFDGKLDFFGYKGVKIKKLFLLKDIKKSGSSCEKYEGFKKYVDTKSVSNNSINSFKLYQFKNKPSRANLVVSNNSVLFAKMQSTVKTCLVYNSNDFIFSTGFYALKSNDVTPEYLFYCLESRRFNKLKDEHCSGTTQKAINDKSLSTIYLLVPKLSVQKMIVKKIQTIITLLNNTRNSIKNLNSLKYRIFNKAIDDAIKGKLCKQNKNDKPAYALIDKISEERNKLIKQKKIKPLKINSLIFKSEDGQFYEKVNNDDPIKLDVPFKIPENWTWVRLKTISSSITAGGDKPSIYSKNKTDKCNIPVYSNGETNDGLFGWTNESKVDAPAITISGRGNIGYTSYRTNNFYPIVRLLVIKLLDGIDYQYISMIISSFLKSGNGSAVQQLTVPMITDTLLPIPPINEQKRIVEKINKILTLTK